MIQNNEKKVLIKGRNLKRYYYRAAETVKALDGIDIDVFAGESLCILGASGSGKTTLINLLSALDAPTEGELFIDGKNVIGLSENQLVDIRRGVIGYVFQKFHLIPTLSVAENVALPLMFLGMPYSDRDIDVILDSVGLLDRRTHKPSELSGGQMQRVAVARALAVKPKVLIADEPTGNLDKQTGDDVFALFLDLVKQQNIGFILTTHNLELAERCDRVIVLEDGKIIS